MLDHMYLHLLRFAQFKAFSNISNSIPHHQNNPHTTWYDKRRSCLFSSLYPFFKHTFVNEIYRLFHFIWKLQYRFIILQMAALVRDLQALVPILASYPTSLVQISMMNNGGTKNRTTAKKVSASPISSLIILLLQVFASSSSSSTNGKKKSNDVGIPVLCYIPPLSRHATRVSSVYPCKQCVSLRSGTGILAVSWYENRGSTCHWKREIPSFSFNISLQQIKKKSPVLLLSKIIR